MSAWTHLPSDAGKDDEEGQVEGGKDSHQGDGGDVTDDGGAIGVGVEGGAAVFAEQVEPASHHLDSEWKNIRVVLEGAVLLSRD